MNKFLLFLFFIFFIRVKAQQELSSINTTATPFLLINPDARSGGMGNVGVAVSTDAFSVFHNPAKIAFNKTSSSVGINYTPWLRNLANDIFVGGGSYVGRLSDNSGFGIEMKYFSLGAIDLRTDVGTQNGSENPNEFALTGAYALRLTDNFSMSVGLKYINSNYKIKSVNTNLDVVNSFAVDISSFYESDEGNYGLFNGVYRFGINIANIGPTVEYTAGSPNFIPTVGKIGGGFEFIFSEISSVSATTEFSKLLIPANPKSERGWFEGIFTSFADESATKELQGVAWALGLEYKYNKSFSLRTGYFHESKNKGNRQFYTIGSGFRGKSFGLDLSYLINTSNSNSPLENTLRFSLSFDFGKVFDRY